MNLFLKRAFDIIFSAIMATILLPLWIALAVAIKVDSRGPVFFKQARLTKDGKIFQMLKFRSMVLNAEQMGTRLFNYSNDPRITKVGRFLRETSLDELPQLFNIFIGDMSVVGPRPCVTYELGDFDTLNKKYKKRFHVKAGLTGLAQVKYRNEMSWDQKVAYDNEYVDQFQKKGILVDIKILFESVIKVFKKENIYEKKTDNSMSDEESARFEEERIIRLAHNPDED